MSLSNSDIAHFLLGYADQLELLHDNPYKIRAYRRGASIINKYPEEISNLINENRDLTQINGIGEGLAAQIKIIVETKKAPILKIKKTSLSIKDKLNLNPKLPNRKIKIYYANLQMQSIIDFLATVKEINRIEIAGDFRRKSEIISNTTIVVATKQPKLVLEKFVNFEQVKEIYALTKHHAIVAMRSEMIIKFLTCKDSEFAANLFLETGSEKHNEKISELFRKQNLTLKSTGLFKNKKIIPTENENDIYHAIKLPFIPPALRENRGEIIAAKKNQLPKLIERKDLRGDLHSHTFETDGTETIEVMVATAKAHGLEYLAITDHSKRLAMVHGLDEERLLKQIKLIDKLNTNLKDFTILKSIEVDILENGDLDLPDWILKELDIRVCSVHSKFKLPLEKQTERIIRAMDNPYFNILGHATGRLMNSRKPYDVDMERIIQAAKDRHCFLELNCQPARLDINDLNCKRAKEIGVKIAISSDSHTIRGFNYLTLGIDQARRGWLEAKDVINTLPWPELKKLIKKK